MHDVVVSSAIAIFTWVPTAVLSVAQGVALPDQSQPLSPADMATYIQSTSDPALYESVLSNWALFVSLSIVVSLALAALLAYCVVRLLEVRHAERERHNAIAHTVAVGEVPKTQLRWNRVREEIQSDDEQKWRLAILEADIMLNELLDVRGYKGETMGDKMKQVDRADFNTIDLAWEAHKVRNAIAHEGSARLLNEREARRVIGLYERVFREFGFVS